MNINIYSSIYENLIDSKVKALSIKALLEKYNISHGQLKTILLKIKENEYISKENTTINNYLIELENYKEEELKVFEKRIEEGENSKKDTFIKKENKVVVLKTKIKEYTIKYSSIILNLIKNLKYKFNKIDIKSKYITATGIFSILFFISLFTFSFNDDKTIKNSTLINTKNQSNINTEKIKSTQKSEIINEPKVVVNNDIEEKLDNMKIIKNEDDDTITAIIDLDYISTSVINPNNIASNKKTKEEGDKKKLNSKQKIKKQPHSILKIKNSLAQIKKHLIYENNMIKYKNRYYKENDILEGYKIFKITPLYVKFEDTNEKIRKRVLLN
ncbi:hypothetical protein AHALO_1418 [Malaciobacter halophilus]|nr:hypothetical protein [Malaciobacter halophilus]AXH09788.1 hypothetical protein AHALO_1418 [Malaciobacter halophilus]